MISIILGDEHFQFVSLFDPVRVSLCPITSLSAWRFPRGRWHTGKSGRGGIVCDALNSVFHLGQRFTEPGQFTITADVFRATPDYLRDFCVPSGTFEGRKVYRVRAPLHPLDQKEGEWPQEG